jgi:hypothetical protein
MFKKTKEMFPIEIPTAGTITKLDSSWHQKANPQAF